jgi:hypothetical protein
MEWLPLEQEKQHENKIEKSEEAAMREQKTKCMIKPHN